MKYLDAKQAASQLGVSVTNVRNLCKSGKLAGAVQKYKGGPWKIPEETVKNYLTSDNSGYTNETAINKPKSKFDKMLRGANNARKIFVGLITFIGIIIAIIGTYEPAVNHLYQWGVLKPFPKASGDKALIIVATFYRTEFIPDHDIQNEIGSGIENAIKDMGLENIYVKVHPMQIKADEVEKAKRIAEEYDASIIIWGSDTGTRLKVNFLNYKNPSFDAAQVEINESGIDGSTQVAHPAAYQEFVTSDLPSQMKFLSLFAIGQAYFGQGDFDSSLTIFRKSLINVSTGEDVNKSLSIANFYVGFLYQQIFEIPEDAHQAYSNAILLDPQNGQAYNNRGLVLMSLGKPKDAMVDLEEAVKLIPTDSKPYSNLGLVKIALGDFIGAIEDLNLAIDHNPDDVIALINRGSAHRYNFEFDQAEKDYQQAIEKQPDLLIGYLNLGNLYFIQAKLDNAIQQYNIAIDRHPENPEAYFYRGKSYYQQGGMWLTDFSQFPVAEEKFMLAEKDFSRVIELEPDYFEAYTERSRTYIFGLSFLYEFIEKSGDVYSFMEKASIDLEMARNLQPDRPEIYRLRVFIDLYKNETELAIDDLSTAIRLDPAYPTPYVTRGDLYYEAGEYQRALDDYKMLLQLSNDPSSENDPNFSLIDKQEIEKKIIEIEGKITN